MVFGNRGEGSGTGVVTTRNVSTGEREMEGDYLSNAQGEDVVSGTRPTLRISALKELHPKLYAQLERHCQKLERHFRDVQDVEFTIEQGKLWMLQTRDAKRTAQAAVRIAVELAREKRITRQEAVLRVKPEQVDFFLHPQFAPADKQAARERGDLLATGLNVSPGAASGVVALDADTAERWSKEEKKAVIMVRPETKPDDVHGMLAAQGILTSRGGRTSHAALVARQFGKPAVVGVSALEVDCEQAAAHRRRARHPRGGDRLHRRHHRRALRGQARDRHPGPEGRAHPRAAAVGRRLPEAGRVRERGLPAGRRAGAASSERRASACAAPSTCSSRRSACPTCSG